MSKRYAAFLGGMIGLLTAPLPTWVRYATRARLAKALVPRVAVAVPGGRAVFYVTSKDALYWPRRAYEAEPDTVAWVDSFTPNDVFWDVGASIGPYAIRAGLKGVRTLAFEPNPLTYEALVMSINASGAAQVSAFCLALSDRPAMTRLYLPALEGGVAGASVHSSKLSRLGWAKEAISVDALTASADYLVSEAGFPAPTRMKIDVDSIEEAILAGARGLLAGTVLREVLVEVGTGEQEKRVADFMAKAGFARKPTGVDAAGRAEINLLFVRRT